MTPLKKLLTMVRHIPLFLRYGIALAAGLILLKTLEYQLFSYRFSLELYGGLVALFFLLVGIAFSINWNSTNKSTTTDIVDHLTPKEINLLKGIATGLSNQQLAEQEFLSVNTVKTHLQKLYRKLEVKNRHQAVAKAKSLNLLVLKD